MIGKFIVFAIWDSAKGSKAALLYLATLGVTAIVMLEWLRPLGYNAATLEYIGALLTIVGGQIVHNQSSKNNAIKIVEKVEENTKITEATKDEVVAMTTPDLHSNPPQDKPC